MARLARVCQRHLPARILRRVLLFRRRRRRGRRGCRRRRADAPRLVVLRVCHEVVSRRAPVVTLPAGVLVRAVVEHLLAHLEREVARLARVR